MSRSEATDIVYVNRLTHVSEASKAGSPAPSSPTTKDASLALAHDHVDLAPTIRRPAVKNEVRREQSHRSNVRNNDNTPYTKLEEHIALPIP